MNERIRELMEQAKRPLGELKPKMANTGAKWDMVLDPVLFAELIVKECADIAYHDTKQISDTSDAEYAASSIKSKFGVK